jgi:hypothetical protein
VTHQRGQNDLTHVGALVAIDHRELLQSRTEVRRAPDTPGVRPQLRADDQYIEDGASNIGVVIPRGKDSRSLAAR